MGIPRGLLISPTISWYTVQQSVVGRVVRCGGAVEYSGAIARPTHIINYYTKQKMVARWPATWFLNYKLFLFPRSFDTARLQATLLLDADFVVELTD